MKKKRRKKQKVSKPRRFGKPIIGVTCEVVKLKPYYSEFELVCDYRYIRAILRAGGIPVLLPLTPFPRDITRMLDCVQGLVITGGADIHPSFYGDKSRQKIQPIYRGRTYFETRLYKLAVKKNLPVLAICHGMQLLNVICGGTLYQDIRSEIRGSRNHRSKSNPLHTVQIQPGSLMHRIFRKKSLTVHSEHHQAVKVPGKALQISAVSEDGIAEAIEGAPNTLAVQWHPERQPKDPVQMRIFRYFMGMVRRPAGKEGTISVLPPVGYTSLAGKASVRL